MSYRKIFILPNVLDAIRTEVKCSPRTETGGALVGYLSATNCVVVTHASGPGPRAMLKRSSVLIDGQFTDQFCTRIYHESNGGLDYIGDWHRHPGLSPLKPSQQDLDAMLIIEDSKCSSIQYPITAICRSFPERIVVYALVNQRLLRIPVKLV